MSDADGWEWGDDLNSVQQFYLCEADFIGSTTTQEPSTTTQEPSTTTQPGESSCVFNKGSKSPRPIDRLCTYDIRWEKCCCVHEVNKVKSVLSCVLRGSGYSCRLCFTVTSGRVPLILLFCDIYKFISRRSVVALCKIIRHSSPTTRNISLLFCDKRASVIR